MHNGQENLGQTAFEKACRGEGLTEAESRSLLASHGVSIVATVRDTMTRETDTTRTQAKEVLQSPRPNTSLPEEKETMVDGKIIQIEGAFSSFEHTFAPLVEKSVREPQMRTALMNPFHIINANRSNHFKNYERARKKAKADGIPVEALMLLLPNPRHFAYAIEPQALAEHSAMIGYSPLHRILAVSPDWDPENALDRFGVYHETVHMMHQAVHRKQNLESFVRFYAGQEHIVVIDEEYDAYALELEALDLQLNGELRRTVAAGKELDPDHIMQMLHIREDQRIPITMLLWFASRYFPHGSIHRYPKTYLESVDRACLHDGFQLFRYDDNHLPTPYRSR